MQETGHVLSIRTMRGLIAVVFAGMLLQTCLADVRRQMSTKTPYTWRQKGSGRFLYRETREPSFVYHLVRHGIRWPTSGSMKRIRKLHSAIQDIPDYVRFLPALEDLMDPVFAGELHEMGYNEMYDLGEKMHAYYPILYSHPVTSTHYYIRSTAKARSAASAVAFGMGLFPHEAAPDGTCRSTAVAIEQRPIHDDPVLRFFDMDPAYDAETDRLEDQMDAELEDVVYPSIARGLDARQGIQLFSRDPTLVRSLWESCTFQWATQKNTSLCDLFTPQEVLLLEWATDFESFLKSGPSFNINCCLAQPLINDLLTTLHGAASGQLEKGRYAHLLFGHAETVLPFACLLNIDASRSATLSHLLQPYPEATVRLRQTELLASFAKQSIWRGAYLSPMGGNVLIALFLDAPIPTVRLYWNEELLTGPWCQGASECPLTTFTASILRGIEHFREDRCSMPWSEAT